MQLSGCTPGKGPLEGESTEYGRNPPSILISRERWDISLKGTKENDTVKNEKHWEATFQNGNPSGVWRTCRTKKQGSGGEETRAGQGQKPSTSKGTSYEGGDLHDSG